MPTADCQNSGVEGKTWSPLYHFSESDDENTRLNNKYQAKKNRKTSATPKVRLAFRGNSIRKGLPCGKGLATHRRVDGIEDGQSVDIRNASNGDRIAQILNLALRVGKRRPRGKTLVVRIA